MNWQMVEHFEHLLGIAVLLGLGTLIRGFRQMISDYKEMKHEAHAHTETEEAVLHKSGVRYFFRTQKAGD